MTNHTAIWFVPRVLQIVDSIWQRSVLGFTPDGQCRSIQNPNVVQISVNIIALHYSQDDYMSDLKWWTAHGDLLNESFRERYCEVPSKAIKADIWVMHCMSTNRSYSRIFPLHRQEAGRGAWTYYLHTLCPFLLKAYIPFCPVYNRVKFKFLNFVWLIYAHLI